MEDRVKFQERLFSTDSSIQKIGIWVEFWRYHDFNNGWVMRRASSRVCDSVISLTQPRHLHVLFPRLRIALQLSLISIVTVCFISLIILAYSLASFRSSPIVLRCAGVSNELCETFVDKMFLTVSRQYVFVYLTHAKGCSARSTYRPQEERIVHFYHRVLLPTSHLHFQPRGVCFDLPPG
jgi:hypothetical protein